VVEFIRLLALQIPLLLFKAIKSSIVHIIYIYPFDNKFFLSLSPISLFRNTWFDTLFLFLVVVLHLVVALAECLIQILAKVALLAGWCARLRLVPLTLMRRRASRIAPITCRLPRIHLAKQQTQHCLTIFPVQVSELNIHVLWAGE